jgi:hypothetical protein
MTRRRKIGTLAALGGFAAAAALLPGLPRAQADELSELKANQQLLQQRIEQLQEQLALGAKPVPPGAPSLAGSFPRSFLIPGTNTSIAIGGYVKFDAALWLNGGTPNATSEVTPSVTGVPSVAGLPLDLKGPGPLFTAPAFNPHSRGNNVFHMSAAESRVRIETRTPTAYGLAGTVIEFDFYGCTASPIDCSNLSGATFGQLPRLRLAYGTLGALHVGQDFIPVNDLASHPELFDFGGDAGEFGFARAPWLGYTWELPYGMSLLAAAVTPSTSFYGPTGALEVDSFGTGLAGTYAAPTGLAVNPNKTTLPDGNFVLRLTRPWGHIAAEAVVQKLELQDGAFITKNYVGYGGGFSGHFIPGWRFAPKDNFGFDAYAGDGLGHYANPPGAGEPGTSNALATNFGGPAVNFYGTGLPGTTTRANAARVLATTVTQYGAEGNYQHWWTPTLRSTISAGVQYADIPTTLVGVNANSLFYNKRLITAHFNLIWSPVAFINTGLEYTYGNRLTILRQSANENVIDFAFQVKF